MFTLISEHHKLLLQYGTFVDRDAGGSAITPTTNPWTLYAGYRNGRVILSKIIRKVVVQPNGAAPPPAYIFVDGTSIYLCCATIVP